MDIFSSIEEEASEQLNLSGESGNEKGKQKDKNGCRRKGDDVSMNICSSLNETILNRSIFSEDDHSYFKEKEGRRYQQQEWK